MKLEFHPEAEVEFIEAAEYYELQVPGLRMHAHDLRLRASMTAYRRSGRGPKTLLRFSKSGERPIEEAYGRHFVALKSAKQV